MKVGSKLLVVGLGALVCISNVIGSLEGGDAKNPTAWFKIKARKKDDAIDVQGGKDKTILVVKSPASIRDGKPNLRQWKDGKEDAPLDQKSPHWIELRILGGDGIAARRLPLNDGHFEITLPEAFFDGNPTSITVSWIDFYR